MAKKMKIGVIGVGSIGTVHTNAYVANGNACEISAICDIDEAKLASHGERLGVKNRFVDYHDLLKSDVDAVSVCVWNNLHAEMAIAAFKAGKHVLLEKPMAMNARQGQEIVDAAEASGKVLQIGMVWRQHKEAQLVKKLIDEGVLGEIYHIRSVLTRRRGIPGLGGWFTTKSRSGGGPLIDLGVHWFDISMYLSGHWNPTSVSATTFNHFTGDMKNYHYTNMWAGPPKYDGVCDVEDYATGHIRFGRKAALSFDISWAGNSDEECFIELLGTKGGVKLFNGQTCNKVLTEVNGLVSDLLPQFQCEDEWFNRQMRLFLTACRGEGKPAATGREGVVVMKVLDAVYESSKQGREVGIE